MDHYTHGHHHSVLSAHKWRTAQNSTAYLLDHIKPGVDVLDVGCGPGTITVDLARLAAPGRVIGVENVPAPLAAARAAAAERGITVDFRLGDAYALEFEDGSFDVVHAHQVLHHLTDPVAALREMKRVCRPGGVVAARESDYAGFAWYPEYDGLARWLDTYRRIAQGNGAEPDAGRRLRAWAHEAGLHDVTSTASVWCFSEPDDRAFWAGGWGERVRSSGFAEHALERGLATPEQLAEMADAFAEWAASDDGWFTVLHGEIVCRVS